MRLLTLDGSVPRVAFMWAIDTAFAALELAAAAAALDEECALDGVEAPLPLLELLLLEPPASSARGLFLPAPEAAEAPPESIELEAAAAAAFEALTEVAAAVAAATAAAALLFAY